MKLKNNKTKTPDNPVSAYPNTSLKEIKTQKCMCNDYLKHQETYTHIKTLNPF